MAVRFNSMAVLPRLSNVVFTVSVILYTDQSIKGFEFLNILKCLQ